MISSHLISSHLTYYWHWDLCCFCMFLLVMVPVCSLYILCFDFTFLRNFMLQVFQLKQIILAYTIWFNVQRSYFKDDSSAYIILYTTVHYLMYIYPSIILWLVRISLLTLIGPVGTALYRQRKQSWADHKLGSVIKYQPKGSGRVNCRGINIQYTYCICIQFWSYYTKISANIMLKEWGSWADLNLGSV